MVKPEAIYLAWLDCRESGLDDPYEFFLQKAKVALNDGKLLVKAAKDLCGWTLHVRAQHWKVR
jgi:bifunctional pyridoxal-dependent enzyme with beta-cystathionase and maltose regulon repressor activities